MAAETARRVACNASLVALIENEQAEPLRHGEGSGPGRWRPAVPQPNGQSFDSVAPNHTQPIGDWKQLPAVHQERGLSINRRTAVTQWAGESMDYGWAVEALLLRSRKSSCSQGLWGVSRF